MRIGELAKTAGIRPDRVRFYERAGALPKAGRRRNRYRQYDVTDAEHLRLLVDLRRLDVPLEEAARLADACASGHVSHLNTEFGGLVAERRVAIAAQIDRLRDLDARLQRLDAHLSASEQAGDFRLGGPCCGAVHDAAGEAGR